MKESTSVLFEWLFPDFFIQFFWRNSSAESWTSDDHHYNTQIWSLGRSESKLPKFWLQGLVIYNGRTIYKIDRRAVHVLFTSQNRYIQVTQKLRISGACIRRWQNNYKVGCLAKTIFKCLVIKNTSFSSEAEVTCKSKHSN